MSQTNELTQLAEFIEKHATNHFDRVMAFEMDQVGEMHSLSAEDCPTGHGAGGAGPCDDYRKMQDLGIAWLKSRVAYEGAR